MTTREIKETLWEKLDLSRRSIIFTIIDIAGEIYRESGMMEDDGDLYNSDAVYDFGSSYPEDEEIHIYSSETFMIGDGESEYADGMDMDLMEELAEAHPAAFRGFLDAYADILVSLDDMDIENPAYSGEEEEE